MKTMFKSIPTALILALISVNLIALENKNAITLSGGSSFTKTTLGDKHVSLLNPKINVGINYLRSINDNFALGIDLQTQLGAKKQRFVESNHNTGDIKIGEVKNNINLITMILTDIKLLQAKQFNLAAQVGAGFATHKVRIGITIYKTHNTPSNEVLISSTREYTFAAKAGLIGQYEIDDNVSLGLGVHYIYTGRHNIEYPGVAFTDTIENIGIITTNVNLTYKF